MARTVSKASSTAKRGTDMLLATAFPMNGETTGGDRAESDIAASVSKAAIARSHIRYDCQQTISAETLAEEALEAAD